MDFKIILSAFLIIFGFCSQANAGKDKLKYPPYPDVWGYDISDDSNQEFPFLCIDKSEDGDYTISYSDKDGESFNVINVFKGGKKKFPNWKELDKYLDSEDKRMFSGSARFASLSDGKLIATGYKLPGSSPYYQYVRRTPGHFDEKDNEYELSPIGIATHCKGGKECINEVYFLASSFIRLEDDTFFVFDSSYYLFIRFDRDFKTKFKSQHTVKLDDNRELKSNFYVLPYSKIKYFLEHVAVWYTGEYNDEVNRRLDRQFLDWLYKEEQKGALE
ncbi:MAG: hypothetical protein K0R73_777 [Candidatus Midichloriaceae bacterium]|jgi:hypothetical protein|nr:hypothetical protein [Candidatus Midichloriaceae bacterium]